MYIFNGGVAWWSVTQEVGVTVSRVGHLIQTDPPRTRHGGPATAPPRTCHGGPTTDLPRTATAHHGPWQSVFAWCATFGNYTSNYTTAYTVARRPTAWWRCLCRCCLQAKWMESTKSCASVDWFLYGWFGEPADAIQSFRRSVTAPQFAADFGNNTLNVKIAYGPQNWSFSITPAQTHSS